MGILSTDSEHCYRGNEPFDLSSEHSEAVYGEHVSFRHVDLPVLTFPFRVDLAGRSTAIVGTALHALIHTLIPGNIKLF